jgi:DNA-binding SARP family transcriptional activator
MRVELLGPLRAFNDDGDDLELVSSSAKELLAVLAMRPGKPMGICWLADALREGRTLSPSALRTRVMVLRRMLRGDRGRVHRSENGYWLDVRPGERDLDDYQRFTEQGRVALAAGKADVAVRLLAGAVSMWREPALANFPRTEPLILEIMQLETMHQRTTELLLDARLGLGHHRELLGQLRAQVKDNPADEVAHERLMVALYRSGRRAEAFEVYDLLRKTLIEWGIDPGASVRDMHQRMLIDDPALEVPPSGLIRLNRWGL